MLVGLCLTGWFLHLGKRPAAKKLSISQEPRETPTVFRGPKWPGWTVRPEFSGICYWSLARLFVVPSRLTWNLLGSMLAGLGSCLNKNQLILHQLSFCPTECFLLFKAERNPIVFV